MTAFQQVNIGAGGFITGIQIADSDGTKLIRTDSYGGYVYDDVAAHWRQIVTVASISPALSVADYTAGGANDAYQGVYEVRLAPSNTSRMYMIYRGRFYRSDDKGLTWTQKTAFTQVVAEPNSGRRLEGPFMDVDPANADVVYVGSMEAGVFFTSDGGTTFSSIAAIPVANTIASNDKPGHKIMFDKYSGTSGSSGAALRTNIVYISSHGHGVYVSDQRVSSGAFAATTAGGPTGIRHLDIASTGALWCSDHDATKAWEYKAAAWATKATQAGLGNDIHTLMCDPNDPLHIVLIGSNSSPIETFDEGTTWSEAEDYFNGGTGPVSPQIPWLQHIGFIAASSAVYDKNVSRRFWLAEGTCVWYMDMPAPPLLFNTEIHYNSVGKGIEQLIGWIALCPPSTSAKTLLSCQDRGVFAITDPTVYPSNYGPNNQFTAGWGLDWASSDPNTVVAICNFDISPFESSAISSDNGVTWTQFADKTPGNTGHGGSIAAASPSNIIWVAANQANRPYVTTNGGTTWTDLTADFLANFGIAQTDASWHSNQYDQRHMVCADRVRANTFYMHNKDGGGVKSGIYRSRASGTAGTWTHIHGPVTAYNSSWCTLRSVPGKIDSLFYTDGYQFNPVPSANPFVYSTDGAATWTTIPGFAEVRTFGFGKAAGSSTHPAICAYGWYNGIPGFWQCVDWDTSQTWQQIADAYPVGWFNDVRSLDGDKNTAGTWYAATQNGFAFLTSSASSPPKLHRMKIHLH